MYSFSLSNFLALIRDPSQNQVAVDRLVKHFDIKETNPSGQFQELKKVPTDKLIECVFKMTKVSTIEVQETFIVFIWFLMVLKIVYMWG